MKLTYEALKAKRPCEDQLKIYLTNFPDNLEITKADVIKAAELGLDINLFASEFLSATVWENYYEAMCPAQEAYNKAMAPAWKAYNKATATALWNVIK